MLMNQNYKLRSKPNKSPNIKFVQGYYTIVNKEKYVGDPALCIYRSSWEFKFCKWADYSPSITRWSSEPISVKYLDKVSKLDECKKLGINPNDPKNWVQKNYHVDFWITVDKGEGKEEKWFIEIKPASKLLKPVPPSLNSSLKEQRRFNREAKEYLINEEKWKAMNEFANKNGCKFYVFTENHLQRLLGRFFL
jgi:hypothetical protein